jgi:hypothetical protein
MARNYTGSYTFSGKACDIEYRSRRLIELTSKATNILESIDPASVQEGSLAAALDLVQQLSEQINRIASSKPAKRAYVKGGKPRPEPEPKPRGRKPKVTPSTEAQGQAPTGALVDENDVLFVGLDDLLIAAE